MQRISLAWLLVSALLLGALVTGCVAPSNEGAEGMRAEAAPSTVVTKALAAAAPATAAVGGSPGLSPSEATAAAASLTARHASPTATSTVTTTPSETATVIPTDQPSPSPSPSASATAAATTTGTSATGSAATATPTGDGGLIAAGLQVYKDQYCGICHQLGAAGTGGLFGPTHEGLGSTAASRVSEQAYKGVATNAEQYIRESIVNPKAFIVPGYSITSHPMPAYDFLSQEEILALVRMLLVQE